MSWLVPEAYKRWLSSSTSCRIDDRLSLVYLAEDRPSTMIANGGLMSGFNEAPRLQKVLEGGCI